MSMMQEPKLAKFYGMPSSAITMGDVDFILSPEKMGNQLLHYTQSPFLLAMDPVVIEDAVSLEPASGGQPNWNVIEMAREGLRMPLVAGLRKAVKQDNTEIISEKVRVRTNGDFELIDVKLIKID
ncbi:hypothetical protein AU255_15805 [Methyloprofundus sedimenti]|uniref:CheB-type methylesterase domain-containing protein n=2 Tax=Methyloprofundus sedimenti TaxID=1420851 RepID=A0A1V8M298_9GAMM|nr:hypothetical protein AU255_15805 [Methyloprofundus sedimenti]